MTLLEAFEHIEEWSQDGERVGECLVRYGRLTIDRGCIERGVEPCPICGYYTGMGQITVTHDDGRRVAIDIRLYHYARAGHPIGEDDIDAETLLAITADR